MFRDILDSYDAVLLSMAREGWEALAAAMLPTLWGLLVLWLVIFGYQVMTGTLQAPVRVGFWGLMKFGFIVSLLSGWGLASRLIYEPLTQIPNAFISLLFGAGLEDDINGSMDRFLFRSWTAAGGIWERSSFVDDFDAIAIASLIYIVSGIVAVTAMGFITLAKIALVVLIMLGPAYLASWIYGATAPLFSGWLRQMFNFALIPTLVYAVLAILMRIAEELLQGMEINAARGDVNAVTMGPYLLAGVSGWLLLLATQGIASGIVGGFYLQAKDFGSMSSNAVKSGAKSAGNKVMEGAKSGAKSVGNRVWGGKR